MVPLPPPEKSKILKTNSSLDANKIRFEINSIQLPIGVKGEFGVIIHPGASLAVPITDDGKIIILRQYRFAVSSRLLEFPAGTLEPGEDPLESMKRELAEESGYEASKWNHLGISVPCPAYSDEFINIYLARGLKQLKEKPQGDLDEDIEVLSMKKEELNNCIASGNEVLDGKSLTAWFRACQFLNISLT
mgnify:CR=1 FL=1|tara:strand:+ start:349 stop:918 length:570 start_codon:yes stop_codon:yes gene_type:complete